MHGDTTTIMGEGGMARFTEEPFIEENGSLTWREGTKVSLDPEVVGSITKPFSPDGGLKLLDGNLGRAVIKTSAVKEENRVVKAPAMVFDGQDEFLEAFKAGQLEKDLVAVIRFQGPKANGMPELHKLTPSLGVLQDKGYKVALVTDGRMSGASGKVPAAIHVTPEVSQKGPLGKVRNGDMILLDGVNGVLEAQVDDSEWGSRPHAESDLSANNFGMGRELFAPLRALVNGAEQGATIFSEV